MQYLHVKAPFAVFRSFVSGYYRPTIGFLTPSAAYGLLMNIAGVETRLDDGKSPATLMKEGLPRFDIAIGSKKTSCNIGKIIQHIHNYPVGSTGKEHRAGAHGSKYNIQPVWRELLINLDAIIAFEASDEIVRRIKNGLNSKGKLDDGRKRYGIPFLGDNNFMIDYLRLLDNGTEPLHWLEEMDDFDGIDDRQIHRMPVWIDRMHMAKTDNRLFAFSQYKASKPLEKAIIRLPPE